MSRLKRRGERILPCAMPESTQGEETELPRRTWNRVPQRNFGEEVPETTRDTEVKQTSQSGFDPAGAKSLLYVDERDKGVLVAADAQGVHKVKAIASAPQRKPPWQGSSCGRMWGAIRA